ncbi:hypothetical protein ACQPXB_36030 [Amycolatopsis sp. CA-161197]|uniref:hypothetical protein n=1 Tax=Amycolatopsis sp. CA-161197 TaxID=3239922 RepID=UPI003D8CBB1C
MTVRTQTTVGPGPAPIPPLPCDVCGQRGLIFPRGEMPTCIFCTPRPIQKRAAA